MRKYAAAIMVDRRYALTGKKERTEICVRAKNAQECDGLARFYSAMYADGVKAEPISEAQPCPTSVT